MEIWKDIKGYEGFYQVSSLGRVRSLLFGKKKVLRPILNNKGYYQVSLKSTKHLINRLVCTAFHPNPENKPHVAHLDDVPSNNKAINLAWATVSENQLYSTKRLGSDAYQATITNDTALRIFKLTKKYPIQEISDRLKISYSIIHKIKRGAAWNSVTGLPRLRFSKFNRQLKTAA